MAHKRCILLLGPLPPPHMGPTLATEVLLRSRLNEEFRLIHLDTSDHRDLSTLGAVDFTNVYLAVKSYLVLIWLIVRHWPDAVYVPISQTTLGYLRDTPYIVISKLFFRRVICHLRGGNFGRWYHSANRVTRLIVRTVHSLVDCQIILGDNLRGMFDSILPKEKLFVVPNGKDVCVPDKSAGNDNGPVRVLFLSNLMRSKGILDAIAAFKIACEECCQLVFEFAGNWLESDVRAEIEDFTKTNPNLPIRYLGRLMGNDKLTTLANSDIFLFPSYYPPEGHPWVTVEAMAAGLPIVSTDQGAISEYVHHGENGFIVEKRDISTMARRLVELAQNKELRNSMGAQSRRLYYERLTEEAMVQQLANAFRHAIRRFPNKVKKEVASSNRVIANQARSANECVD